MEKMSKAGGSRYVEIADELCADIRAGKYDATHSFPSLTGIMRRFGVARATAAKSVDELKRRGAVSSLPRSGLAVRKNRTIGIILPGVAYSEFFPPIMSGISRRCQEAGYGLLFGDVYSKIHEVRAQQAKTLAKDFAQKHVSGVIFQPIEFVSNATRINKEIVSILSDTGIPVVLIDYDIVPPPERSAFDLVGINNFEAGRRLATHLLTAGAKNIHFLMRRHWAASVRNRLAGVNYAIFRGGGAKCLNILHADPEDTPTIRAYMKKHRPDAIICGNDTAAAYLKHTLDTLGKRVPDDIMLAGFDDVQFAKVMTPQLTTIHQPCDDIAAMAFRALQERIETPSLPSREILLSAPLVVRESTARCQNATTPRHGSLLYMSKMKKMARMAVACTAMAVLAPASAAEIEFENPLPRRRCGQVLCGTYNNYELSLPGVLTTSDPDLGLFLQKMRETIMANRRLLFIDGKTLVCNHNWIRDHVHQMKGWRHWEYDPLSFLQFIIDTQRADGQFFELVKQMDDLHWAWVNEDCRRMYPADNLSLVRLELEADVEYLVVEGAWTYYGMTGDDAWLERVLPALEKGIDYQTSDRKRWSPEFGLAIRPYTIDTWDFTYDLSSGTNRTIRGPMCAMHGDNTGVFQAMNQLAWLNRRLGREGKAAEWLKRAGELKSNIMRHLWNGKFFVHQFPVDGNPPYDGKEAIRLSLSDSYALNRGILSGDECRAVIDAFIERGKVSGAFAEWFTVDPAYEPSFMKYRPGVYVNGAISPFTAGELAKGAFANGREEYGWDVISRWIVKVAKDKAIYFLYDRNTGGPISVNSGPSAWGAAALMNAVDEGLAGVVNAGVGYDRLEFSPRWPVTHYRELRYLTGVEFTGKYVDVRWILVDKGMRYSVRSPAKAIKAHMLLPKGRHCKRLLVNGKDTMFAETKVDGSLYVDCDTVAGGVVDFEIIFASNDMVRAVHSSQYGDGT